MKSRIRDQLDVAGRVAPVGVTMPCPFVEVAIKLFGVNSNVDPTRTKCRTIQRR